MLFGFLVAVFIFVCFLLLLMIMIQQGKGGLGLGSLGGGAQMLFGGSGGQDIFQKITWTLGAIFMLGSFFLFMMKSAQTTTSKYFNNQKIVKQQPVRPADMPVPQSPSK